MPNNSGNAICRCCFPGQVRYCFVGNVSGERDKANPDNSETQFSFRFAPFDVLIYRHSPEQRGTGCNLNKAIDSKPDKRDAPSKQSRR